MVLNLKVVQIVKILNVVLVQVKDKIFQIKILQQDLNFVKETFLTKLLICIIHFSENIVRNPNSKKTIKIDINFIRAQGDYAF